MNNIYYQKLLDIVKLIEQKRKLGWLLMSNNEQINSEIVFNTPFNEDCIAFKNSKNSYSTIIINNKTTSFGKSTFNLEAKAALSYFKKNYYLFEPKKIHKFK